MEHQEINEKLKDKDSLIRKRYQGAIDYYWKTSKSNKRWYKITRSLTVIIGAIVTLIAALTSSEVFAETPVIRTIFTLGTPILAAVLTIVAGFSQSFQWGSAWHNMVITAQNLQKEFDKYQVTPLEEINFAEEAEMLNQFVIIESEGFFSRMLGSATKENKN